MTQEQFYELANEWHNIFLSGNWGTWKSWAINKWCEDNNLKKIIRVAPTGIAAINCWWETIHSVFKLYWSNYHVFRKQDIDWSIIDVLILDEISMVSGEMFDYMWEVIKRAYHNDKPFGNIQVIVVGDLAQLPPVYNFKEEWIKDKYNQRIKDFWWITFKHSKAYKEWNFKEIHLTENKRTTDDKLISLLNRLRTWDRTAINEFQHEWYSAQFYNKAVHIMPYNYQVDKLNEERLSKLPWKTFKFMWFTKGEFNLNNVLVPLELKLKVWARVMCVKNLECWLVNGDCWEIIAINKDEIIFKSDRLWEDFEIHTEKWTNIHYDAEWNKEEKWCFVQFPLKLWYGITSHKSQGLTLDKVIFHYDSSLSNELVYTACSRATTFNWLYVI